MLSEISQTGKQIPNDLTYVQSKTEKKNNSNPCSCIQRTDRWLPEVEENGQNVWRVSKGTNFQLWNKSWDVNIQHGDHS